MSRQANGDDKTTTDNVVNAVSDSKQDDVVNTSKIEKLIPIREPLVAKASLFLERLPVEYCNSKASNFLRSKGLTDHELLESIQRASAIRIKKQNSNNCLSSQAYDNFLNEFDANLTPFESDGWFKKFQWCIVFAASIVYIGHMIYKKFIKSWFFDKEKSKLEKRFDSLEQTCMKVLDMIKNNSSNNNKCNVQQKEIQLIKDELKSIKGLLLNKSQFTPPPGPLVYHMGNYRKTLNRK